MAERVAVTPELLSLADSWALTLEAENKSQRTVAIYTESVRYLAAFLDDKGMPAGVADVAREHIEAYIADVLATRKAATASIRYRSLRRFFDWCREEGEITESPMRNMHGPAVPEEEVPVLGEDELKRLLKACEGSDFMERRDMALVLFLLDTGVRRGECAGMTVDVIDLRSERPSGLHAERDGARPAPLADDVGHLGQPAETIYRVEPVDPSAPAVRLDMWWITWLNDAVGLPGIIDRCHAYWRGDASEDHNPNLRTLGVAVQLRPDGG